MTKERIGKTTWLNSGNNPEGIGINFHRIQYEAENGEKTTILMDAGNMFAKSEDEDIDVIILDLEEQFKNADALFLTHGHLDHIGSIPHMLALGKRIPPIYGSPYTLATLEAQFAAMGLDESRYPEMHAIGSALGKSKSVTKIKDVEITAFPVEHSILGALAFGIKTPSMTLFNPGDFRLNEMRVGRKMNIEDIQDYFRDGVDFMFADSTSTISEKMPVTEKEITKEFRKILRENDGKNIVATMISNNIGPRGHSLIAGAAAEGYAVLLEGMAMKSAWTNTLIAAAVENVCDIEKTVKETLKVDMGLENPVRIYNSNWGLQAIKKNKYNYLTVVTGSNGEPNSVLDLITRGLHRGNAKIDENTVVVFSQRTIPGNEKAVEKLKDELKEMGATIVDGLHASGHASGPEMHEFLWNVTKAIGNDKTIVIPSHGFPEYLTATDNVAKVLDLDTFQAVAGDVVLLDPANPQKIGTEDLAIMAVKSAEEVKPGDGIKPEVTTYYVYTPIKLVEGKWEKIKLDRMSGYSVDKDEASLMANKNISPSNDNIMGKLKRWGCGVKQMSPQLQKAAEKSASKADKKARRDDRKQKRQARKHMGKAAMVARKHGGRERG